MSVFSHKKNLKRFLIESFNYTVCSSSKFFKSMECKFEGWDMVKNMTMTWKCEVLLPWHMIVSNQSDVALYWIIILRYNNRHFTRLVRSPFLSAYFPVKHSTLQNKHNLTNFYSLLYRHEGGNFCKLWKIIRQKITKG